MYTLIYAANKNMGDFLIYDRAKALLREHKGMRKYLEFHGRREGLDSHLREINSTKAVIICGGPGTVWNMYPKNYQLATNLDDIKVPVIIMGSGWYGVPGDDATLAQYSFNESTMRLFDRIRSQGHAIGVRDKLTESALRNNGVTNVMMTGCPSWYDLQHIESPFDIPDFIDSVVFTPPASRVFQQQAVDVMGMLRQFFPKSRLICSFHRGIKSDEQTPEGEAKWLGELDHAARNLGFEVIDVSYGLKNAAFYDECDLHVGYRVHGHIYFLSQRKPSFLIHEDGRGRGVSESLDLPGIQGWERTFAGRLASKVNEPRLSTILGRYNLVLRARESVAPELEQIMTRELSNGLVRFRQLDQTFHKYYRTMVRFLDAIP